VISDQVSDTLLNSNVYINAGTGAPSYSTIMIEVDTSSVGSYKGYMLLVKWLGENFEQSECEMLRYVLRTNSPVWLMMET
jgi:hypothetical protein